VGFRDALDDGGVLDRRRSQDDAVDAQLEQ
jgi:hypothetical protein